MAEAVSHAKLLFSRVLFLLGVLALCFCNGKRSLEPPDSGPGPTTVGIPNSGPCDHRLAWVARVGSDDIDWGGDVSLDDSGGVCFSGNHCAGAGVYDADGQEAYFFAGSGIGIENGFIACCSESGEVQWAESIGGTGDDKVLSVDFSEQGGLLFAGWFGEKMVLGEDGPGQITLQEEGHRDGYVGLLDGQGGIEWVKSFGGPAGLDFYNDVNALADGRVAAVGAFFQSAVVGPGEPNETLLEKQGEDEGGVIAVYSSQGMLEWARSVAWTEEGKDSSATGVSVLSDGSLVVGGAFEERAVFGRGGTNETTLVAEGKQDGFVARYTGEGDLLWAVGMEISGDISVGVHSGAHTAIADDGDIIAATGFCGSAPVGREGEPLEQHHTPEDLCTPYLARFTDDGERIWSVAPGGGGVLSHAIGVSVLPDGTIAMTGRFGGTAVFGMGESSETLLEVEGTDLFFTYGFISLYDSDGFLNWALPVETLSRGWCNGVDSNETSIVFTCSVGGGKAFGTGPFDSEILEYAGVLDAFLIKLQIPPPPD